jgi:hypothetical protein
MACARHLPGRAPMSGAVVSQRLPVLALLGAALLRGLTWLPLERVCPSFAVYSIC